MPQVLHRDAAVGLVLVVLLLTGALATPACTHSAPPDAYGNVEATDVVVSAEIGGQLLSFVPTEGVTLAAGAIVGSTDTTQLALQREQLVAQRSATAARIDELAEQIRVLEAQRDAARAQQAALEAQREVARRAYERTERLAMERAATAQQLDQTEKEYRVLLEQINAQAHQVETQERQIAATRAQQQTTRRQVASVEAQAAQIDERLRKSRITNPIAGTVLATYAKAGEFMQPGQPLYKIANLDAVDVRAYVTEPQLAGLGIGQTAHVSVDMSAADRRVLAGTLSWVSSEAEFAPTPIQTRDERANLVYAVKIRVVNERHILKIGMPVDVQFIPKASTS
jgi:HlyD family secretion protein